MKILSEYMCTAKIEGVFPGIRPIATRFKSVNKILPYFCFCIHHRHFVRKRETLLGQIHVTLGSWDPSIASRPYGE